MKHLILLLLFISCTREETKTIEIKAIPKELFTTTQSYEISCWIIKRGEGYSSKPYLCSAGKRTVGWGMTNIKSVKNIQHADKIFKELRNKLFKQVEKEYPTLTYLQKSAILSLYYNTGSLEKIKNSGFSKALVLKDNKKAIENFKKWCKISINKKIIIIKGLQNRRTYESKLLNGTFTMNDYQVLKKEIEHIYVLNKTT